MSLFKIMLTICLVLFSNQLTALEITFEEDEMNVISPISKEENICNLNIKKPEFYDKLLKDENDLFNYIKQNKIEGLKDIFTLTLYMYSTDDEVDKSLLEKVNKIFFTTDSYEKDFFEKLMKEPGNVGDHEIISFSYENLKNFLENYVLKCSDIIFCENLIVSKYEHDITKLKYDKLPKNEQDGYKLIYDDFNKCWHYSVYYCGNTKLYFDVPTEWDIRYGSDNWVREFNKEQKCFYWIKDDENINK